VERVKEAAKLFNNKINWIGHILRRHCLLKHVIEGKIEGTGRQESEKKTWAATGN
jgi:hypothetical protein